MLIVGNVNGTVLGIKGVVNKPMNCPLPMKDLYLHFMFLLAFVLMLGLGFGGCLSPGNVYLVVGMAIGCVLWSACTCNSKVSTFLRRMQKK